MVEDREKSIDSRAYFGMLVGVLTVMLGGIVTSDLNRPLRMSLAAAFATGLVILLAKLSVAMRKK